VKTLKTSQVEYIYQVLTKVYQRLTQARWSFHTACTGSFTLIDDTTRQGGKFCRWRLGRLAGTCKAATGAKAMFLESLG
jgi:hypothetical protein